MQEKEKKRTSMLQNLLRITQEYEGALRFLFENENQLYIEVDFPILTKVINQISFSLHLREAIKHFKQATMLIVNRKQINGDTLKNSVTSQKKKVIGKLNLKTKSFTDSLDILAFLQNNVPTNNNNPSRTFLHASLRLIKTYLNENSTPRSTERHLKKVREKNAKLAITTQDSIYNKLPAISKGNRDKPLALSDGQCRLAYLENLNSHFSNYNWLMSFNIEGNLNIQALEKAIKYLIERHESLRTGIDFEKKEQLITSAKNINWGLEHEIITRDVNPEQLISHISETYTQRKFDLKSPPLIRSKIVEIQQKGKKKFLLFCVVHHSIFDGYSQTIFLKELSICYKHFLEHTSTESLTLKLPDIKIQYIDYCNWLDQFPPTYKNQQLEYWKEKLKDVEPLMLATDFPRPSVKTFKGDRVPINLSRELLDSLKALSKQYDTTLFTVLLASFQCLLYRYTGQLDICTGTMTANRKKGKLIQKQLENTIGFIANTIPIRSLLSPEQTVEDLIKATKQNVEISIYKNADVTFGEIVSAVKPAYDPSRNPIFDTLFVMQDPNYQNLKLADKTRPIENGWRTSRFDLVLELRETMNGLTGFIEYSNLFLKITIERMIENYKILLSNFNLSHQKISWLPILSPAETKTIKSFNQPVSYKQTHCIHEVFEKNAKIFPQKTAIVFKNQTITYQQLNDAANQVTNNLLTLGVKPKRIIAICMERSVATETILLGILKAGCAVVFLETAEEHKIVINKKINTLQPTAIITDETTQYLFSGDEFIQDTTYQPKFLLNTELLKPPSKTFSKVNVSVDDLALIAFTSGYNPKAVMVPHRGWTNWVHYFEKYTDRYNMRTPSNVFLTSADIFDASFWERFVLAYGLGETLHITPSHESKDATVLKALFKKYKIAVATFTPSFLSTLNPEDFPTLKCIFVVGETLSKELVTHWKKTIPHLVFVNGWGPTEGTAGQTLQVCESNQSILIGKSIINTTLYILDNNKQPVPIGVEGEIYIGGVGVARGYCKQPELSAKVFIKDPYSSIEDAKLYRTGDKARFTPDGNIDFRGRIDGDRQVKIHGVRIELDEIESLLSTHPSVKKAIVRAWDNNSYLAAYLMTPENKPFDKNILNQYLKQKGLKIVPAAFLQITEIPLTKTGKLNLKALPRPSAGQMFFDDLIEEPKTETEEKLLKIWQEILPFLSHLSTTHDFWEVGGDSFTHIALLNKINEQILTESDSKFMLTDFPNKFTIQNLGKEIDKIKNPKKFNLHTTKSFEDSWQEYYSQFSLS